MEKVDKMILKFIRSRNTYYYLKKFEKEKQKEGNHPTPGYIVKSQRLK